jgi:sec-independent protein translocase protein TatC
MARIRPVGHEDQLSLIEHLDELRTRLIICVVGFVIVFAVCFWQNDVLLDVINRPLEESTTETRVETADGRLEGTAQFQTQLRDALERTSTALDRLAASPTAENADDRRALDEAAESLRAAVAALPETVPPRQPVTLGVGEPFFTTLTVSGWFALLFSLPLILYQLYAFILPAFSPNERRIALPVLICVPVLFVAGVVFGYVVVLPSALTFLQNFNAEEFDILLQAKDYYRFAVLALGAMGLLFQIPVGVLAFTRAGIVSVHTLRRNRRYAVLVIAILAMLLPGTDPVTMLLAMIPLAVLFEGSLLLAAVFERRAAAPEDELASADTGG